MITAISGKQSLSKVESRYFVVVSSDFGSLENFHHPSNATKNSFLQNHQKKSPKSQTLSPSNNPRSNAKKCKK
jgi:hypothetical protein